MTYITNNTPENMIEAIFAIDKSFRFENKDEMTLKLNSIGLSEIKDYERYTVNGHYVWFEGAINNTQMALRMSCKTKEEAYVLMEKHFYTLINEVRVNHRDSDLPSFIWHNTYDEHASIRTLNYFIEGEASRCDPLKAPFISFYDDKVGYRYKLPNYDDRPKNSVIISTINSQNNIVIDILAHYCHTDISLEKLIEIIPRTKEFSFREFANLKNEITKEENILLHMMTI